MIDDRDPIYAQLQQFIMDLNQKQAQNEVVKAEEFPTFGEADNKKKMIKNKRDIYDGVVGEKEKEERRRKKKGKGDGDGVGGKQHMQPIKRSIINELQE